MFFCRKIARDLRISHTSAQRILKDDRKLQSYRERVQPKISEDQKAKDRKLKVGYERTFVERGHFDIFVFWRKTVRHRWSLQIWASSVVPKLMQKLASRKHRNFRKLWSSLGLVPKECHPLVSFEERTMNHVQDTREVFPMALKLGNEMFDNGWTFQRDGRRSHVHRKTQDWCPTTLPSFIDKEHWLLNSPDFILLDYGIWDELVGTVNWNRVTPKATRPKLSLKKLRFLKVGYLWSIDYIEWKKVNGDYFFYGKKNFLAKKNMKNWLEILKKNQ